MRIYHFNNKNIRHLLWSYINMEIISVFSNTASSVHSMTKDYL